MSVKKQICFKVAGTVADQITEAVKTEGWATTSKFCESIILKYLEREADEERQRQSALAAIESPEGIALVKRIMDRELLRRAVGDIDPNRSD